LSVLIEFLGGIGLVEQLVTDSHPNHDEPG
jgi:hypothetical protein